MLAQTEPWLHRASSDDGTTAAQSASLLALSNGYIGIRGATEEGSPGAGSGTLLNGFFENVPAGITDAGYGDPPIDEALAPVADGTRIELTIEGEPLDVETGNVIAHTRELDFLTGQMTRSLRWRSPAGHEVFIRTRRLVSLRHREIAAIEYEVESDSEVRVEIRSTLAVRSGERPTSADPRAGSHEADTALLPVDATKVGDRAVLIHRTRVSGLTVAAGMAHQTDDCVCETRIDKLGSTATWNASFLLKPRRPIRFAKFLAYHWTSERPPAELLRRCRASLDTAASLGFDELARLQHDDLAVMWRTGDIEIGGDNELQHALRYALFQIHMNAACADGHGIPAKGLTGRGYSGHTFWDTEIFLLPLLMHCAPGHAAAALRWRSSTLPQARARARELGLSGAAFPWRTISGAECSGYLPAGTAAFHVNADIAFAFTAFVAATGDQDFERDVAVPVLVETARLWVSLGYHDHDNHDRFSIDGVTGPDEYSVLVDNNAYTNLMAKANLLSAIDVVERYGSEHCGVGSKELSTWRVAAAAIFLPFDEVLGIHLQDEDFSRHEHFNFDDVGPDHYPLFLHVPYFHLYRKQVIKQPDLVLAMALHPAAFEREQAVRNFAHYEALTVRDSTLAAGTLSAVAARLGDMQLAYDYFAEAILLDHHDLARNTADGLHLATLGGGWTAAIQGFAGAQVLDGRLAFSPRLPTQLDRMAFTYAFRGRQLRVELSQIQANYELTKGSALRIEHWGNALELTKGIPETATIPDAPGVECFRQPAGRAPARRRPLD